VVISVAEPGRPPTIVLKLPRHANGVAALERQAAVLTALLADQRLGDGYDLLPRPLAQGVIDGQFYLTEKALPGREARFVLHDPAAGQRAHEAAIAGMSQIHRQTASTLMIDRTLLESWVDRPLAAIRRLVAPAAPAGHFDRSLQGIAHGLHNALLGRTVQVSWIHGDFWVSNLRVTAGGDRLTGIVDWDRAAPDELPAHDLLQLLIQTRRLLARQPEIRE
jgi:aminoglycoside phosphotransferase (APT) family kinase protein